MLKLTGKWWRQGETKCEIQDSLQSTEPVGPGLVQTGWDERTRDYSFQMRIWPWITFSKWFGIYTPLLEGPDFFYSVFMEKMVRLKHQFHKMFSNSNKSQIIDTYTRALLIYPTGHVVFRQNPPSCLHHSLTDLTTPESRGINMKKKS